MRLKLGRCRAFRSLVHVEIALASKKTWLGPFKFQLYSHAVMFLLEECMWKKLTLR